MKVQTNMRAALLALLLFLGPSGAVGANITYTTDTVWSGSAKISGRTVVAKGTTLTIEPGTIVNIEGFDRAELIVWGCVRARGTIERPIRFEVETDGHYWSGITLRGAEATAQVEHCVLRNGRPGITCDGSSPVIRKNTFDNPAMRGASILCLNGSRAIIESNKLIGHEGAGILVIDAEPSITENLFIGFQAGVQISDRTRRFVRDAEEKLTRVPYRQTSKQLHPACGGNLSQGGIEVFDERIVSGELWGLIFTSGILPMTGNRIVSAHQSNEGDWLHVTNTGEWPDPPPTEHTLRLTLNGFELQEKTVSHEIVAPYKEREKSVCLRTKNGGHERQVLFLKTVLGQLGQEGCADTKPAHVLVTTKAVDQTKTLPEKLLWASPQFDWGLLRLAAADMDADGHDEIVVVTKGRCAEKGKILVFAEKRD